MKSEPSISLQRFSNPDEFGYPDGKRQIEIVRDGQAERIANWRLRLRLRAVLN